MRPVLYSSSCILVEDAKAVAQDEEPRDLTSSQAPTEGEYSWKLCNCIGVLSCKSMSRLNKIYIYIKIILHFFP
jgi:hypothetical protein